MLTRYIWKVFWNILSKQTLLSLPLLLSLSVSLSLSVPLKIHTHTYTQTHTHSHTHTHTQWAWELLKTFYGPELISFLFLVLYLHLFTFVIKSTPGVVLIKNYLRLLTNKWFFCRKKGKKSYLPSKYSFKMFSLCTVIWDFDVMY